MKTNNKNEDTTGFLVAIDDAGIVHKGTPEVSDDPIFINDLDELNIEQFEILAKVNKAVHEATANLPAEQVNWLSEFWAGSRVEFAPDSCTLILVDDAGIPQNFPGVGEDSLE